jgi:hypothetical protein
MQNLPCLEGGQALYRNGCYQGTPAAVGTGSIVYRLWD